MIKEGLPQKRNRNAWPHEYYTNTVFKPMLSLYWERSYYTERILIGNGKRTTDTKEKMKQ
jgi:hypothetical protein